MVISKARIMNSKGHVCMKKTFVRQKLLLEAGFCGLTSKTSGLTIM